MLTPFPCRKHTSSDVQCRCQYVDIKPSSHLLPTLSEPESTQCTPLALSCCCRLSNSSLLARYNSCASLSLFVTNETSALKLSSRRPIAICSAYCIER